MVHDNIKDVVKNVVEKARNNSYNDILFKGYTDLENNSNIKEKPLTHIFRLALVFMVVDMVAFCFMETWGAPIVIGFLQIIILLIMGVSGGLTDFSTAFNFIGLFGSKDNEPKQQKTAVTEDYKG